ncbi:MAG: acetyl-CoA carboxylase carboxyl transferase subunit beta [Dehalococcoidia bacterium]|nr:acetyl-CoA carboxylase carboxyl transferase subunit beta [Dehalococcoidia bacterium]
MTHQASQQPSDKLPPESGPMELSPADLLLEGQNRCLDCGAELGNSPLYKRYRVCPRCRFHYHLPARQRLELVTDPGTLQETNPALVPTDPLGFADRVPYRERLAQAQSATGLSECVVTGTAYIGGMEAVLAVMDVGFMGGTIGSAAGEKITQAAEMALERRIPFVLLASGGAPRIREGVLSLMQLAKMVSATKRLRKKGVPFIAQLASPTSGHLLITVASNADVIFAEPRALIGFAPRRQARQATGQALPEGSQTAEYAMAHGMVDAIISRPELKQRLAMVLDLLGFKYRLTASRRTRPHQVERPVAPAWERVQLSRHQERPTSHDYITRMISTFVELHGDRLHGDDPAIICGMGYLAGEGVMVVAQERGRGGEASRHRGGRIYPEGFRKAQRAMQMAARFNLPVITLIDTPGAYQGLEAEEHGVTEAIGATIDEMSDLPTPIITAIIGEGGSEGALAMSVADRILMQENAIFSPVSPEAAAELVYRNTERAGDAASALKLTAHDCRALGIIDVLVPEPEGGAHTDVDEAARQLERLLVQSLLDVQMSFKRTLIRKRYAKFRRMGTSSTVFENTLAAQAAEVQEQVIRSAKGIKSRLLRRLGRGPRAAPTPRQ